MIEWRCQKVDEVEISFTKKQVGDYVEIWTMRCEQEDEKVFPSFSVDCALPMVDTHYYWSPSSMHMRRLPADTFSGVNSKATIFAPVGIFYSANDENRVTIALSDSLNSISLNMGVREENGHLVSRIDFFNEPTKPSKVYEVDIRVDLRQVPFYTALGDVAMWWEGYPLLKPTHVPQIAKKPMYSTWYSFHQVMTDSEIEEQCRIAKGLGCQAIIVDDGWQTLDNQRGYAYTGDWKV